MKIFEDVETGKSWQKSICDLNLEILCVSQFTLYGTVNKGVKPDFHLAMQADQARSTFAQFVELLQKVYAEDKIKTGVFQAMMQVNIVNDGPVTLVLESKKIKEQNNARVVLKDQRRQQKWSKQHANAIDKNVDTNT